jgi:hypothetical protein
MTVNECTYTYVGVPGTFLGGVVKQICESERPFAGLSGIGLCPDSIYIVSKWP